MPKRITVYSIEELKEKFPDAYDKEYNIYRQSVENSPYMAWQSEIMDSLNATFKKSNVTLKDWSIGTYQSNWARFTIPTYWSELADEDSLVDDYTGELAYNWLKESFGISSFERIEYMDENNHIAIQYDFKILDGQDWDCEFTGYCADYDFLASLFESIYDGRTLNYAYENLANVAGKLFEQELEFVLSEECFLENNGNCYTKYGVII